MFYAEHFLFPPVFPSRFNIQRREPQGVIEEIIDDDISITYERTPAFHQKMKAARFQLPTTFYLYEADDLPQLPFQRKSRHTDAIPKIEDTQDEVKSSDSKPNFGITFGSGLIMGFGSGFSGSSFATNTQSGFSSAVSTSTVLSQPVTPVVNKSPQQQNVSPSKTVIPGTLMLFGWISCLFHFSCPFFSCSWL